MGHRGRPSVDTRIGNKGRSGGAGDRHLTSVKTRPLTEHFQGQSCHIRAFYYGQVKKSTYLRDGEFTVQIQWARARSGYSKTLTSSRRIKFRDSAFLHHW
jgi:hypothetical protein